MIKRIAAVLWWLGVVCGALAAFGYVQSSLGEARCIEYQAQVRLEITRREAKLPSAPCQSGGGLGTIVPLCDLPDEALLAVLRKPSSCNMRSSWALAAMGALVSFVVAFILGGSLLRPPKLQ